ncbi:hypothetical protein CLOM_g12327 [Closterium sp. NIES-68]|nr:hypothetical protein CLOM_g12327 [Closterium sp. NIES-68]
MAMDRSLSAVSHSSMLLLSLVLLGTCLWAMLSTPVSHCLMAYQLPLVIIAAVLLLAAIVGLLSLACDHGGLGCLHLSLALAAIPALVGYTIFLFVVTGGGAAEKSRGQTVYAPATFSSWMQNQVYNDATWTTLQTCLKDIHTGAAEAGCCLPPENCFVNSSLPTYFSFAFDLPTTNAPPITENPPAAAPGRDPRNCSAFSLESSQLCYSCEYCKGGVIQQLKSDFLTEAYFSVGVASTMLVVAFIMCCTQCGRGKRDDDKRRLLDDRSSISMSRTASFQGPHLNRVNTYQSQGGPQFNRVNTYQSQGGPEFNRVNTYQSSGGDPEFQRANTYQSGRDGSQFTRPMSGQGPRRPMNQHQGYGRIGEMPSPRDSDYGMDEPDLSRNKTWSGSNPPPMEARTPRGGGGEGEGGAVGGGGRVGEGEGGHLSKGKGMCEARPGDRRAAGGVWVQMSTWKRRHAPRRDRKALQDQWHLHRGHLHPWHLNQWHINTRMKMWRHKQALT